MPSNRHIRQSAPTVGEPRLGRMLLLSLGAHLLVVLLVFGPLHARFGQQKRHVYYVDLVNLPVAHPRAGRPDGQSSHHVRPRHPQAKPTPKPHRTPPPAHKREVVKVARPKPAPPKPVPKRRPHSKPKPKPSVNTEKELQSTLAKMRQQMQARQEQERRKQEIAALEAKLAAMAAQEKQRASEAPAGETHGTGKQTGVAYDTWIHAYLKQAWTLSRYQVDRMNLQATVELVFDAQGNLLDYHFVDRSGEERFDNSVKRAILQLKTLPTPPGRRLEIPVVFNLKDLLNKR